MPTLYELLGPEKLEDFRRIAQAAAEEKARTALAEEAAAGQKVIEGAKQIASEAPEYSSKMAEGVSKAAKAAEGTTGKGVISDLPQVSGKMGAAAEKAARAAAGTAGEGVIPLGGEVAASATKPAMVASKAAPFSEAILANPFLSKIAGMAATPAGKMTLRGMGGAGLIAGLYGDDLAEDSDSPKNVFSGDAKQLTPQQMASLAAPGKKLAYVPDSGQRTLKDELAQVASSMPKKTDEASIVAEAMASPKSPEYLALEAEERKKLEGIQKAFERRSDMSNEDKARHYDTAAKQFTPEKIQERVEKKLAEIEDKKSELSTRLAEIDSKLSSETNPFRKKELLEQQARFSSELASLAPQVSNDRNVAKGTLGQIIAEASRPKEEEPTKQVAAPVVEEKKELPVAPKKSAPGRASKQQKEQEEKAVETVLKASGKSEEETKSLLDMYKAARAKEEERLGKVQSMELISRLISARAGITPDTSYYDTLRKQVKDVENLKEEESFRREAAKNDPKSEESKSYRALLAEQGIKVPETVTAAFIEKQYPQFANIVARREAAADRAQEFALRREEIAKSKADKEFVQLYDSLDPTKGRAGQFGEQYKIVAQADRLGGLIDKSKYGMNLTGPEMEELALGTARLLAGAGGSSRAQIEALVPSSARGKVSDMIGWITNNPTGRQQQEFVKRTKALLDREKALAQDKLEATIRQRAKARGHLKTSDPGLYEEAVNSALETFAGRGAKSQTVPSQDPEVQKYANEHFGGDYQKAMSFLEKRARK